MGRCRLGSSRRIVKRSGHTPDTQTRTNARTTAVGTRHAGRQGGRKAGDARLPLPHRDMGKRIASCVTKREMPSNSRAESPGTSGCETMIGVVRVARTPETWVLSFRSPGDPLLSTRSPSSKDLASRRVLAFPSFSSHPRFIPTIVPVVPTCSLLGLGFPLFSSLYRCLGPVMSTMPSPAFSLRHRVCSYISLGHV